MPSHSPYALYSLTWSNGSAIAQLFNLRSKFKSDAITSAHYFMLGSLNYIRIRDLFEIEVFPYTEKPLHISLITN